jgi:hypothetical protein
VLERLRSFVFDQKCIPWSVSHRFEVWMETRARLRAPAFYRLVRFGRATDPVRAVTRGPRHHFYGYYDKSPWNASATRLLVHQVGFTDRPPGADDVATLGVVHLDDADRFEPIATTRAWNFQQGAMLRWHPADPEHTILYNDRREGAFVAVQRHLVSGEERVHPRPLYAVAPDGRHAYSLNFARLQEHRPGYGYAGVPDPFGGAHHPAQDGIHRLDLDSGDAELVLSLERLATNDATPDMRDTVHWVNHVQVSPSGRRFAFLHRWRVGESGWGTRLYAAEANGSGLTLLLGAGMVSHYDWQDDDRILVWARHPETGQDRFLKVDVAHGVTGVFGEGSLVQDGHCSFSPDRRWVLNDTYPDPYRLRTLMVVRYADEQRIDLARLYAPAAIAGEIRCDLHPRWRPDGRQVCIDSVHTGERQVYLVNLPSMVRP